MRILSLFITMCLVTSTAFAVTMEIPFRCWEEKLIEEFKKEGINLDKSDPLADGCIENMGSSYKIHLNNRPERLDVFIEVPRRVQKELECLLEQNTRN